MKKVYIFIICLLVVFAVASSAVAADKAMDAELRAVVEANFVALANEDVDAAMKTIHTQAPGYLQTKELSNQLFPYYDLKYELLEFNYIAIDGEYALARAIQKTIKVDGPAFQNNIVDFIYVFKQEDGVWKFWSQAIVDTKFID
ncbi:MAG: nuclear transport factor 2 family protein [PVC group bacterium]|nr:nuclear transport factor 2 family protein [PVC group bacterium]